MFLINSRFVNNFQIISKYNRNFYVNERTFMNARVSRPIVSESNNETDGGERRKRQANSKTGGGSCHVEAERKVSTQL